MQPVEPVVVTEVVGDVIPEGEDGNVPPAVVEGITVVDGEIQTLPVADATEVVIEAPRKSGSKADWAEYAAAKFGYEASEDLSRDQLVERYGEKE